MGVEKYQDRHNEVRKMINKPLDVGEKALEPVGVEDWLLNWLKSANPPPEKQKNII